MNIERSRKNISVSNVVLGTIGVVGLMSLAVLSPNAVQALKLIPGFDKRKYHKESYVRVTINRLVDGGYLVFKEKDGKKHAQLTEKGKKKLLKYEIQKLGILKPKRWDKKWRVIIFDVKEYKRAYRDQLRTHLSDIGFVKLQNSVWVYPYPCEEFVFLLKTEIGLGKDIICMTVEKIENDEWLRREFDLK